MPVRVLVVDDSAFMRRVIGQAITSQPDMELVGVAHNGLDALLKVEQLQPDLITLDVEMPEMDGLSALRHLMARYPRPVVMLSSMTQDGAATTLRALSIGAVDFVAKSSGVISLDFDRVRDELLQKIRVAAGARIGGRAAPTPRTLDAHPALRLSSPLPVGEAARSAGEGAVWAENAPSPAALAQREGHHPGGFAPARAGDFKRLVIIGASTGGPRALGALVPELPADNRTAYLLVQHMPSGFTRSLADRLDASSQIPVREAGRADHLTAGTALVAPGDYHLRVTPSGGVQLDQSPRVHGVRPSIDVALRSAAEHFGTRTVAVILTGMGQDGAVGAAAVRAAGGYVLAEDEATCVVWGMPRAVVERGLAQRVAPLD